MASSLTPDQMQALLQYASKRLGTTPEKLAATMQTGGLAGLSSLSPDLGTADTQKIQDVLQDKSKAEQILQSPEAQDLIRKILGKG